MTQCRKLILRNVFSFHLEMNPLSKIIFSRGIIQKGDDFIVIILRFERNHFEVLNVCVIRAFNKRGQYSLMFRFKSYFMEVEWTVNFQGIEFYGAISRAQFIAATFIRS